MSENESKKTPNEDKVEVVAEPVVAVVEKLETPITDKAESVVEVVEVVSEKIETTVENKEAEDGKKSIKAKLCNKKFGMYVSAFLIVVLIIAGVLFFLEKEGRSSTHLFTKVIDNLAVAEVNGEKITKADLKTSIEQFSQMAAAQGVDITTSEAKEQINTQALDVLVNTELLRQKAADKGITVTNEEVEERIETIKTDIGGEEVLNGRLTELGIDKEKLYQDVNDEILIQRLLDGIFEEKSIATTEEEILKMYNDAGGVDAGLPPLEEVRAQIEENIKTSKEQGVIDELLIELKSGAKIEMK